MQHFDLDCHVQGLLDEYNVDNRDFSESVKKEIEKFKNWSIPPEEYTCRTDFRNNVVITIDPPMTRDADDALHIKDIGSDIVEVGVHIADVSFFVKFNTELDLEAKHRCTSVYLVKKVIPMLPRQLTTDLCSLTSGEDHLTFSVMFHINKKSGEILKHWFCRSIIRPAVALTYEEAQTIIYHPYTDFDVEASLSLCIKDSHTGQQISQVVHQLHNLAQKLRKKRFQKGVLRLDRPTLLFDFDDASGMPISCHTHLNGSAHYLVEEFMILANVTVAKCIYSFEPELAILRRHPAPDEYKMRKMLQEKLVSYFGFRINGSSAVMLRDSLYDCRNVVIWRDRGMWPVIKELFLTTMQAAQYFCTGSKVCTDLNDFFHYGLREDFYTHFTSPIRRYPDLMVHRLLATILGYNENMEKKSVELQITANRASSRMKAAKKVSERSADMMFAAFVKHMILFDEQAVVIQVFKKSFDVYMLSYGITKRINVNEIDRVNSGNYCEGPPPELNLVYYGDDETTVTCCFKLSSFTRLDLQIVSVSGDIEYKINIKFPNDSSSIMDQSAVIQ